MQAEPQRSGAGLRGFGRVQLYALRRYLRGKRPSFSHAAKGDLAVPCYEKFLDEMSHQGLKDVQHGEFGADMKIDLVNDGPVTIVH